MSQPTYVRNVVHAIKKDYSVIKVRNALGHTEWSISRKVTDKEFWNQLGQLPNPVLQRVYHILTEGV
jgi:hypothetical protein